MGRCWEGYKPTPGKKPYEEGSCIKKAEIEPDSQYVKISGKDGWHKIVDIKDTGIHAHKSGGGNVYTVQSHSGQKHDVHQSKITSHAFGSDIVSLNKHVDFEFYDDGSIDAIIPDGFPKDLETRLVKQLEKLGYTEMLDKGLKAEHKSSKGGMTAAGVAAYRRENPGSKLQTAVSEKNPTGKRAKRRKSFCARMSGNPGPMKDDKGRPTRKALALKRWRC
jgi:hypothetical protein